MKNNRWRAQVERLEAREVLSGVHPAAMSDPSGPLHARGTGTFVSQQAILNGSYVTVSNIKGRARDLGRFTGQLEILYGSDQFSVKAVKAVFVSQENNQLITVGRGSFAIPKPGAAGTPGKLKVKVIGGTGVFQGASGKLHIGIIRNFQAGSSRFTVHGTVHTIL